MQNETEDRETYPDGSKSNVSNTTDGENTSGGRSGAGRGLGRGGGKGRRDGTGGGRGRGGGGKGGAPEMIGRPGVSVIFFFFTFPAFQLPATLEREIAEGRKELEGMQG